MTSGGYTLDEALKLHRLPKPPKRGRPACRRAAKYDGSTPPQCRPTCQTCIDKWIAHELSAPMQVATK